MAKQSPFTPGRTGLVAAISASVLLGGCASWFSAPEEPEVEEPPHEYPQRKLDYGVSYIKPHSDIVIMESSYEHVVLPGGQLVMYRPDWEIDQLNRVAASLDEGLADFSFDEPDQATDETRKSDQGDERATASGDDAHAAESDQDAGEGEPRYEAWRKLCDDELDDMTDGDWFLVQTTEIPDQLATRCDGEAELSRFK